MVIGAGFTGAAFATLLRRWRPATRVLLVEQNERSSRKVGEATVEISSFFMHRVLGLYDVMAREHLPKHGLRFWVCDGEEAALTELSEVGPKSIPRLPSFLLDRARLDDHLARLAQQEGSTLLRPAKVKAVEHGWPESRVEIEDGEGLRTVRCRWVIDASGRHAFVARRLRTYRRVEEHPTMALWARWRGVADLDGPAVLGTDARRPRLPEMEAARHLGTNHFCGHGWWCWTISLSSGETSVGLVFNKALFQLPGSGTLAERYKAFVTSQVGLRELLIGAQLDEEDFNTYGHLPYRSSQYMDRGWALVGDAASFIDPFYSPGLDHAAISIYATARLLEADLEGKLDDGALGHEIQLHNEAFERSYDRWLAAIYLGKYELMGDVELLSASFLMDTALYHMGIVTQAYADIDELANPVFGAPIVATRLFFWMMRGYNHRLMRLARFRRQTGTYGKRNRHWRLWAKPAGIGMASLPMLRQGAMLFLKANLEYFWYRLRNWGRIELSQPVTRTLQQRADPVI